MEIKADEITKIIREEIEEYRAGVEISEIGSVIPSVMASPACMASKKRWRANFSRSLMESWVLR